MSMVAWKHQTVSTERVVYNIHTVQGKLLTTWPAAAVDTGSSQTVDGEIGSLQDDCFTIQPTISHIQTQS